MPYSVDVKSGRVLKDGKPVAFVPSPHVGARMEPRGIVYHDTAGSNAAGAVAWFRNPSSRVSAHLVVDLDGTVTQCVLLDRVAWHTGTKRNGDTIGIEIANVGELDLKGYSRATKKTYDDCVECTAATHGGKRKWRPYTPAQMDAVEALTVAIAAAYPIAEQLAHWQLCPGRKVDPTPLFPWERMRACFKPRPALAAAAAGVDVKAAQEKLNELGYGAGAADGIIGPRTRGAIRTFQEQNHLPITGVLNAETYALLFKPPTPKMLALFDGAPVATLSAEYQHLAQQLDGPKPMPLGLRAEMTAEDLKAAGSQTVVNAGRTRLASKVMLAVEAGSVVGDVTSQFDRIEDTTKLIDRAGEIAGNLERVAAWLLTPPGLKSLAVMAVCAGIWLASNWIEARRVKDAQTGANTKG